MSYQTNITENFKRSEFACGCGCGYDSIDERLVHRLQVIRDYIRQSMIINSGCRCLSHNNNVGGAPSSLHTKGQAVDFWVRDSRGIADGHAMARIAQEFGNWSGGFKYYDDKLFIHVDIGPRRRW